MDTRDRIIILCSAVLLAAAGLSGGLNAWGGAADSLPILIWAITLPAIAVWLGRRLKKAIFATVISGILGAIFFLSSLLVYHSRHQEDDLFALLISILVPAVIAAISSSSRYREPVDWGSQDELRHLAHDLKRRAIIGIILFGQLVQPAVLDSAYRIMAQGKKLNDDDVIRSANTARKIALFVVALIIIANVGAVTLAAINIRH